MIRPTKEQLEDLYLEKNLSRLAVARELGCSHNTVLTYLKLYGIPIKSISEVMTGRKHSKEHNLAISKSSNNKKGSESPFWKGGRYIDSKGYYRIRIGNQYVKEHRYVMEQHLGRKLSSREDVHHKNGIKLDNQISNLIVLSKSEHTKLHLTPERRLYLAQKSREARKNKFWSTRPKKGKGKYHGTFKCNEHFCPGCLRD